MLNVLILLCLFIIYKLLNQQPKQCNSGSGLIQELNFSPFNEKLNNFDTSYVVENKKAYFIPLYYIKEGFMAYSYIGDSEMLVVIDTGSSSLVISGEGCEGCPSKGYKYEKSQYDTTKVIQYGSQDNHVITKHDVMYLMTDDDWVVFDDVKLLVTQKIVLKDLNADDGEEEDVFDVFGISPSVSGSDFWNSQSVFTNRKFEVYAHRNSGYMYLGGWTREGIILKMLDISYLCNMLNRFRCSETFFPMIKGDVVFNDNIVIKDMVIMVDTGFTDCAAHSSVLKKLKGKSSFTMSLDIEDGKYTNTFTDELKNIDPIDFHPQFMILGNRWMLDGNKYIGYDFDKRILSIA